MRGRKPKPTALKLIEGNPGKRSITGREPKPPSSVPTCPSHLSASAKAEWKRLARTLNEIGLLTQIDRGVLAAHCQAHGRWVVAEPRLAETPPILKTPAGNVQISPWITTSNKQVELMTRLMGELGLSPTSRSRLAVQVGAEAEPWKWDS